jgi:hypothetical protein
MARFYGTVQGGRGRATRLGHATTGLTVTAESWQGRLHVHLSTEGEEDHIELLIKGDGMPYRTLYRGPIAALLDQGARLRMFQDVVGDTLNGHG